MIIAGTGHRPNKLGGYSDSAFDALCEIIHDWLDENPQVEKIISGMALGWDMALADTAVVKGIPLVAAVPFVGQERMWPDKSRRVYHDLLGKATEVVTVSDGGYAPWKMQTRNAWMVDSCTHVLAMWDGSAGGTANCVKYAQGVNKPVINLWSPLGVRVDKYDTTR